MKLMITAVVWGCSAVALTSLSAADPRQYACVILGERATDSRQFGHWAMGYGVGQDAADDASLDAIVAALVADLDDADLRAQFIGFAALQARAA